MCDKGLYYSTSPWPVSSVISITIIIDGPNLQSALIKRVRQLTIDFPAVGVSGGPQGRSFHKSAIPVPRQAVSIWTARGYCGGMSREGDDWSWRQKAQF